MPPKPVHIITGFLGSGKTTLLNRLLGLEAFGNTLVIINEFGEISLDHHMVEASTETIFELSNGCLCCSMRGELLDTLQSVDVARFDRIVIETTGIADPVPVFQSLCEPSLAERGLVPAKVLTVLDARRYRSLLETHREASRQLAIADIVFVSHLDEEAAIHAPREFVKAINPQAEVLSDPESVDLQSVPALPKTLPPLAPLPHGGGYKNALLVSERAKPISVIREFLEYLSVRFGNKLLRLKGFAHCDGFENPLLIQMSGSFIHDPQVFDHWPDNVPQTRLVAILQNMDPADITAAFHSFMDVPATDQPDRQALTDNPLSIHGM